MPSILETKQNLLIFQEILLWEPSNTPGYDVFNQLIITADTATPTYPLVRQCFNPGGQRTSDG